MIGTELETRLLGALLRDNGQVRDVLGRVTGSEFPTPALGAVFDGLIGALSRGERISTLSIVDYFEPWGVRGVGIAEPFEWDRVDTVTRDAPAMADKIRAGHLRDAGRAQARQLLEDLKDGGVNPVTALADFAARAAALVSESIPDRNNGQRLSEILQAEDTYDWVIPGVLERGDRLVVTGSEGGGKTTLLRQIALCAAGGIQPFTKAHMKPVRVAVVDSENSERQWRRGSRWIVNQILSLGAKANPADTHVWTTRRMDITRATDLAAIHRMLDQQGPDLLMIGPLYRLVPRAITNDDDAAPVIAALDSIRDRGITLVMEAHAGKATDADGDRNMAPRGSSALLGWPEFGVGMRPVRDDPNLMAMVRWRGDRDVRHWPTHVYRGGDLPWTPSQV